MSCQLVAGQRTCIAAAIAELHKMLTAVDYYTAIEDISLRNNSDLTIS